jgi:CRISPR-associated protein Cas2
VSADSVRRYLIAYDISDDPRRNRVAKTLESYGDRIQYSVFLVDVRPAKLLRLRAALRQVMDPDGDCALICDLGPLSHGGHRRMEFIGHPPAYTSEGPLIL